MIDRPPTVIPVRLVDRVERSLRRRLPTNVRAHLERYAARADSPEEFIQSASRLLIDVQQRQHFLTSWARRLREGLHAEQDDTAPAPLEGIAPAASE